MLAIVTISLVDFLDIRLYKHGHHAHVFLLYIRDGGLLVRYGRNVTMGTTG